MSELSKTRLNTDLAPADARYAGAFYGLPLQAALNMLDAYQPSGGTQDDADVRGAMEAVRQELLVSGQASHGMTVDLSNVSDDTLRHAADYMWDRVDPKLVDRFRAIGGKVIPITRRQPA